MKLLRPRYTGEVQDERNATLRTAEAQSSTNPPRTGMRVIAPLDDVQAGQTSQSKQVGRAGSASHWSAAEVEVAGSPMPPDEPSRGFQLVRAWDGLVTATTAETLVVRIVPTDGDGPEEEAEFFIADVREEDRSLIVDGALLYWFVGYESERGRRRRTSELKMRRIKFGLEAPAKWVEEIESITLGIGESLPTEG